MSSVTRLKDESGTALLLAMVLMTILGLLASVIGVTAQMEILLGARFAHGRQLGYAADGALGLALADLTTADWSAALLGAPSSFTDGNPLVARSVPGIGSLLFCCNQGSLTAAVARAANGGRTWGANTPQWRLYAWGPASGWTAGERGTPPMMVGVWIADDPSDNDGDPTRDANGIIQIFAVAVGVGEGRRGIRALAVRPTDEAGILLPEGITVVSFYETQW